MDEDDPDNLNGPVSIDEVRVAIFQMGANIAPRLDGLPPFSF